MLLSSYHLLSQWHQSIRMATHTCWRMFGQSCFYELEEAEHEKSNPVSAINPMSKYLRQDCQINIFNRKVAKIAVSELVSLKDVKYFF